MRAKGKSYAVNATIGLLPPFRFVMSGTVTLDCIKKALLGRSRRAVVCGVVAVSYGSGLPSRRWSPLTVRVVHVPEPPSGGRSVSVRFPALPGLTGSKRYVVLHSLAHRLDLSHQVGEVVRTGDEIDLRAIDHEQRAIIIIEEKIPICLRDALHVFRRNAALVITVALAQAIHEDISTCL